MLSLCEAAPHATLFPDSRLLPSGAVAERTSRCKTLPITPEVDKSPLRRSFAFRQTSQSLGFEGPLLHVAPSVMRHGSRVALQFSPIMNKRPIRICGTEGQSLRYEARVPLQTGQSRSFRSASFLSVSESLLALIGISSGTYLGFKASG
jgi:hypothetical protein